LRVHGNVGERREIRRGFHVCGGLFFVGHSAENNRNFVVIPNPFQRPFRGRFQRVRAFENLGGFFRQAVRELAAEERLHHKNGNPLPRRRKQT
jgi:hypothetical protein